MIILRTNIVTREQLDLIVDMTMKVNSELSKALLVQETNTSRCKSNLDSTMEKYI